LKASRSRRFALLALAAPAALLGAWSGLLLAGQGEAAPAPPAPTAGTSNLRVFGGGVLAFGGFPALVAAATGDQASEITFGAAGQALPQAVFAATITSPATGLTTLGAPLTAIWLGNTQAAFDAGLTPASIQAPGQVQGRVRLEGEATSLGGYVTAAGQVHFLEADGRFSFLWSGGPADITIRAPGYLSAVVPQAEVASGGVLTIPELTLPFGDANGDGRIDVLDLSMAAANFGEESHPMPPP
jgi:hypothetical protein